MLHDSRIYIIISTITGLAICLMAFNVANGGIDMDTSLVLSLVAVATALIGVIGTGIVEILKSKKQSGEIRDGIGKVKDDTEYMKPKTQNIEELTKKIRDEVVETLVPDMRKISDISSSMSTEIRDIYSELDHQKRLKAEISSNVISKDRFVGGIEKLYEKNGQLEIENRELRYQLNQAQEQNQFLSDKINELNEVNRELSKQLNNPTQSNKKDIQTPILF